MKRYFLTPAARDDLVDIYEYIRQDKPNTAQRVLSEIRGAMRHLAQIPGMGHVREDLTDDEGIRFWPIYSFLIIYRSSTRPLQIIRVLRGVRDVRRILEPVSPKPSPTS